MYSIRHAAGKGIGAFTTTSVPRGTRLLAERPLLTVKSERDAYRAIGRLPATDRAWLRGLTTTASQQHSVVNWIATAWSLMRSGNIPSVIAVREYNTVVPVFRNNNFNIGSGIQAMFRNISRLNHSCLPNCQGNLNEATEKFTIHAIRPIAPDEEITISYLDEHLQTRESRQNQLRHQYGFDCNCPLCDLNSSTARDREQRRTQMREKVEKNAKLAALTNRGSVQAELALLVDMIHIFEDEEVAGRELATM